jgi:hypothetical protein
MGLQNAAMDSMKRNPRATEKGEWMNYGGNSQDETEVTIRLDRGARHAHLCSTWPEWSRKLEGLYGSPKKVTERDGKATSAFWVVPLSAIRVRRPAHGRAWTVEQRRAAADRLQKARSSRGRLATTVA